MALLLANPHIHTNKMSFQVMALTPGVLIFIISPVILFVLLVLCIVHINRSRRTSPTMAELRTGRALARMLESQPQIHDIWLDGSEKGYVEEIGGLNGLPFAIQSIPKQPDSFILATMVIMPRNRRDSWYMDHKGIDVQIATTTLSAKS